MERRLGLRHTQPLPELGSIDNNDNVRRPNRIGPFIFPLSLISVIIHIFLSSYKNRAYRKTIPTCAKTRRARTQGRDAGWFLPGARPKGITTRRQISKTRNRCQWRKFSFSFPQVARGPASPMSMMLAGPESPYPMPGAYSWSNRYTL